VVEVSAQLSEALSGVLYGTSDVLRRRTLVALIAATALVGLAPAGVAQGAGAAKKRSSRSATHVGLSWA
jgi:hypothetical protein